MMKLSASDKIGSRWLSNLSHWHAEVVKLGVGTRSSENF